MTPRGAFAVLDEQLLHHFLCSHLDGEAVVRLGACSKELYAVCMDDEVWNALLQSFACVLQHLPNFVSGARLQYWPALNLSRLDTVAWCPAPSLTAQSRFQFRAREGSASAVLSGAVLPSSVSPPF